MFTSLEILNLKTHAALRYQPVSGYGYARKVTSAPLAASELPRAACHFPILFPKTGRIIPVALFGLEKDKSLFVDEAGDWAADYVPAHIRRYPFILGQTGEKNRYSVMIDRAAPHFSADAGEPLFVDGAPVPGGVVIRAREVLAQFQKELEQTEQFLAPLLEHDVLTERRFAVRRDGTQTIAVEGFRQVDEKKVAGLADSVLASWVRSGLMAAVIAHLQSLHNAQRMAQR